VQVVSLKFLTVRSWSLGVPINLFQTKELFHYRTTLLFLCHLRFSEMLRLSERTLAFKGEDSKQFLAKHNNGLNLLPDLLEDPMVVPEDITSLQVSSFRNPFREIA